MRDLLADLTQALDQGHDCVYCSVVDTRGSTPQKAGAAMLVFADGSQSGTLGGGCVEAEVKQRALLTLTDPGAELPAVLTFNLDDSYGWDDGLICGGRMHILVDPLARAAPAQRRARSLQYYRHFRALVEAGRGCTEAVVLQQQPTGLPAGSRFLFDHAGTLVEQVAAAPFPDSIRRHLVPLPQRPRPYAHQGISFLPILPRITVFLIGGGHIGRAVARLADDVDFDVWVLDDRERYVNRERFPTAQRLLVGDIGRTLQELAHSDITPATYVVIVTRGHVHDEEALYHLATTSAGYLGMIGSKRKIKLIYEDLLARGIAQEALERVHAPLGFAIGSQTVPEIAVSIVAELIACRNLGHTLAETRLPVQG